VNRLTNERLDEVFWPAQGRKLVLLSGHAIVDLFYINYIDPTANLVKALHRLGHEAFGYDVTLSFDRSGKERFGNDKMQQIFDRLASAITEDRPGEPPKHEFKRTTDRPAATKDAASSNEVAKIEAAASPALRNLLGKIERAIKSDKKLLAIFEEPESLWMGSLSNHVCDLLRQVVHFTSSQHTHPETKVILIVKPGRCEEMKQALEYAAVTRPSLREIEVGPPRASELRRFLDHFMMTTSDVIGTDAEKNQTVCEWSQRKESLRNLRDTLRGLLVLPTRPQRLDSVLRRQTGVETPDDVLEDLKQLVALEAIKERLHNLFRLIQQQVQDRRSGRVVSPINTHMVFLGNPGTGKSEVARLVGRYLKAIGLRSTGAFVEISRRDITSQFNSGECIEKMKNAINAATGGVLFVDEAYQLAESDWMQGALETLMKDMEDKRDVLTVIFAGYHDQMQRLWELNPGFRSRIPKDSVIDFPDYKGGELLEMTLREFNKRGLECDADIQDDVLGFIESELRLGRFDNGRGVRNLVEEVERNRALAGGGKVTRKMIPTPPRYATVRVQELLSQLDKEMVGVKTLKDFLRMAANRAETAQRLNRPVDGLFHCRFVGPPGTGKTTAARKVGEIFRAMGLLSRGHVIEINPIAELGSRYVSEYAQRVKQQFERARGGVLFIDEAYQLAEQEQGRQIINQIVQELTNLTFADTVLVLAGYRERMNELLTANPGLERRVPNEIVFEPFSVELLVKLFHRKINAKAYVIMREDRAQFDQALSAQLEGMLVSPTFGNAGAVDVFANQVIDRQTARIKQSQCVERMRLLPEDVGGGLGPRDSDSVGAILEDFQKQFVGLEPIKHRIQVLVQETRITNALGTPRPRAPRLLFLGNPGTGKTTAAREFARILRALGCTPTDRFVETRGTELKASYVGQTKDRVIKLFQDARGGCLIIDEAYALRSSHPEADRFDAEAIDTIVGQVTLPENAQTMVILSGYAKPMRAFLQSNPGLSSRFPEAIMFQNYSAEECLMILGRWIGRIEPENSLPQEGSATQALLSAFNEMRQGPAFGNARDVETMASKIREARNTRLVPLPLKQVREFARFTVEDVLNGIQLWRESQILH